MIQQIKVNKLKIRQQKSIFYWIRSYFLFDFENKFNPIQTQIKCKYDFIHCHP